MSNPQGTEFTNGGSAAGSPQAQPVLSLTAPPGGSGASQANDAPPSTTPTPPADASLLPEGTSTTTVPNTTNPSDAPPNANPTSSTTVPGTTATADTLPNTTSTGVASLALPSTAAGTAAPDASLTTLPPGSLISDKGEEYTPVARPAIVKRVHEKKGRRKPREEPGKPGRVLWVWGTKLTFFEKRKGDFVTAFEKKVAGDFYTKMTRLYTVKYGRGLADDEDFEFNVADPPDWVANKVVNERLTPEETKFRNEWHSKFRDRVGNWYRTQYQSLLKEDKTTFSEIFGRLGEGPWRPPRRPQLLHFYSEKRYDSHIKPLVEARKRALAKQEECWDEEPLSVQEEVVRERDSARESLKSAAHYLQPFVDVIAEQYGMCVSILMAGPIGEHGGRIEMRSVHSGKTRGLVEKDWPLQDPEGFTRVQTSMVDFAHHVFSRAECEARLTAVQELDSSGTPEATSSSSAPVAPGSRRPSPSAEAGAGTSTSEGGAGGNADNVTGGGGGSSTHNGGANTTPGGGGSENGGGENGTLPEDAGEEDSVRAQVNKLWQRKDAGKWSAEISRAHKVFERGKEWGIEWVSLVDKFFDFEAAWGYSDAGGQITTSERPAALDWWIGRGRKWEKTPDLGVLGDAKMPGTFVAKFWDWWMNVQPKDTRHHQKSSSFDA
ncbi:hypothetical protein DFH08DRAFT_953111 [Mycena albidolilacea]|uniref:Uncharacterized protein n=1 Tax=Mycena albidolilacea TaxID=1033008 RepID=A0AAD7AG84_9AGAR|nr:hypothetical protein DFH08DRAFT_953111 [Mycena albidolilacea]